MTKLSDLADQLPDKPRSGEEKSARLARNQKIADSLRPVLDGVDKIIRESQTIGGLQLEDYEQAAKDMREPIGRLEAFPFPETLNKAEVMRVECEVFDAVIEVLRVRLRQRDLLIKGGSFTTGEQILRMMGL